MQVCPCDSPRPLYYDLTENSFHPGSHVECKNLLRQLNKTLYLYLGLVVLTI